MRVLTSVAPVPSPMVASACLGEVGGLLLGELRETALSEHLLVVALHGLAELICEVFGDLLLEVGERSLKSGCVLALERLGELLGGLGGLAIQVDGHGCPPFLPLGA